MFPFGFAVFRSRVWDELGAAHGRALLGVWSAQFPHTPASLLDSLVTATIRPERMGHYGAGLGAALPIAVLAGVLLLPWVSHLARQALAVSAGFYLLWFLVSSHELRLRIVSLLALPGANAMTCLADRFGRAQAPPIVGAVTLALALWQWPWTRGDQRELAKRGWAYTTGELSSAAYLTRRVGGFELFAEANRVLPADARALLFPWETRSYLLDRAYLWGNLASQRLIRFERFDDPPSLFAFLRGLGVTHVLHNTSWSYAGLRDWPKTARLMDVVEQYCSRLLFGEPPDAVYALARCEAGSLR